MEEALTLTLTSSSHTHATRLEETGYGARKETADAGGRRRGWGRRVSLMCMCV